MSYYHYLPETPPPPDVLSESFRDEVFDVLHDASQSAFVTFAGGGSAINRTSFSRVVDAVFHAQVTTVLMPFIASADNQSDAVNAVLLVEASKMVFRADLLEDRLFNVSDANHDGVIDEQEFGNVVAVATFTPMVLAMRVLNGDDSDVVHTANVTAVVTDLMGECSVFVAVSCTLTRLLSYHRINSNDTVTLVFTSVGLLGNFGPPRNTYVKFFLKLSTISYRVQLHIIFCIF